MAEKRIQYTQIGGKAVPVRGNDIDTDRIIPARFMKCVTFDGLGAYAFYDVRFGEDGKALSHPFNDERFAGHEVLLVNRNFGCGSSREHAPQALQKWGIKSVIGESFAEIFAGNCTAMGIPAVKVDSASMEQLQALAETAPETVITIDLVHSTVKAGHLNIPCTMPEAYRKSLVQGSWDSTGVLLENLAAIQESAKRLPYTSW